MCIITSSYLNPQNLYKNMNEKKIINIILDKHYSLHF